MTKSEELQFSTLKELIANKDVVLEIKNTRIKELEKMAFYEIEYQNLYGDKSKILYRDELKKVESNLSKSNGRIEELRDRVFGLEGIIKNLINPDMQMSEQKDFITEESINNR